MTLCERPREMQYRGPRAVHFAWNTTSEGEFSLLTQRGIHRVKMHRHTNTSQPKCIVKRVLLVKSPRCVYAFGKLLTHAKGKKRCLLEGFQKDCSKTLRTFLLPWPSICSSSVNSLVPSRAGKRATALSAPIDQTDPESSRAQETGSAWLFRTARHVQITEGFHSLITSHLLNGWSFPIRNGCSHFGQLKQSIHSLFCST